MSLRAPRAVFTAGPPLALTGTLDSQGTVTFRDTEFSACLPVHPDSVSHPPRTRTHTHGHAAHGHTHGTRIHMAHGHTHGTQTHAHMAHGHTWTHTHTAHVHTWAHACTHMAHAHTRTTHTLRFSLGQTVFKAETNPVKLPGNVKYFLKCFEIFSPHNLGS